jgi:hypothetical protein
MFIRLFRSSSLWQEIHVDGVIRKYRATFISFLQYACPKQNMYVAEDRAEVAFHPTCNLANSHRSLVVCSSGRCQLYDGAGAYAAKLYRGL